MNLDHFNDKYSKYLNMVETIATSHPQRFPIDQN